MKTFTFKNKTNSWMAVNIYQMTEENFSLLKDGTAVERAKFYIDKEDFESPVVCTSVENELCDTAINSNKPELNEGDVFELLTATLVYEDDTLKSGNFTYAVNDQYNIKAINI
jgi:dolichyl-phosphate-mannose--protein O-mannosyl transferase